MVLGNFSEFDLLIVDELSINPIDQFSLIQAYPNPFNSFITFTIGELTNENIDISVFNIYGQTIDNFLFKSTINKSIVWDASDYDSGIYLIKNINCLISGDLIMDGSTVVISPPDGDLGSFMNSFAFNTFFVLVSR